MQSVAVALFLDRVFPTRRLGRIGLAASACVLLAVASVAAQAGAPRVLPAGKAPDDSRLLPLKDYDGYFPFTPSKTPQEWAKRAERVRRQILVSQGLWPLPAKTPLNAVIHGKVERPDYTVERVYFESFPGFYVTGSLYRPKGKSGRVPAVLEPHGHWPDGRFHDKGLDAVRREIVEGGERFEEGGRSPLQARCVQTARMGCIAFHYDMIGYADSVQLSFELVHRFAKQRPEMNTPENWGLFSAPAESRLQSVMGLQTWNSIRALDFVAGLPDVDAQRIAVTGASGGGTQTMLLGAIDPRCAVVYPAVMVSTGMQGGCTCENASCLRVDTGNIEFAALFAPKPQGMSAANDWTREMATKGFPELQRHYAMLGAKDNVFLKATTHFGHNYNYVNRAAMYGWFNKHLKLGLPEPIVEEDYQRLTRDEMTVWDDKHPRPASGADFERRLVRHWTEDAGRQLAAVEPTDAARLNQFREIVGGGVDAVLTRGLPPASELEYDQSHKVDRGDSLEIAGLLRNSRRGEQLPICFLYPKKWEGQVVVWLHPEGKAGLWSAGGSLRAEIEQLLKAGASVIGVDLLHQGEFLADGKPLTTTPRVKNPREFAGYTFGFNHSVLASRAHDVLSVVAFARGHELTPKRVDLVGLEGDMGLVAALARAQARDAIHGAAINTSGFRFAQLLDVHDVRFLPGGAKYGDVPALLALAAPARLLLAGEGKTAPAVVAAAYATENGSSALLPVAADATQTLARTIDWLLARP